MIRSLRANPLGAATAGGLAIFVMLLIAVTQSWGPLYSLDNWSVNQLHGVAIQHSAWTQLMRGVSDAGSIYAYGPLFAIIAAVLLLKRRWAEAFIVIATVLANTRVNDMVKLAVGRQRPSLPSPVDIVPGLSFPSGHAQSAVVAWTLIAWLTTGAVSGRWRWLTVSLPVVAILAIGLSRVALGVHYPSDVAAGYALGGAWVAVALALLRSRERPVGTLPAADPSNGCRQDAP